MVMKIFDTVILVLAVVVLIGLTTLALFGSLVVAVFLAKGTWEMGVGMDYLPEVGVQTAKWAKFSIALFYEFIFLSILSRMG